MADQPVLRAYVSLGSNCESATAMLDAARSALAALPDMRMGAVSPVYRTEPQEYADQPWFHNQVVELLPGESWQPCSLVDALLDIEAMLGRVRSADPALRYGPRVIDADLLVFGQLRSTDPHCLVPHPRLTGRAFALRPLLDVAPRLEVDGVPVSQWLERLDCRVDGDRIFQ
ncbi:MAG: 2-amino-4-hydroxy-6-hydroxymethyldihydropteridine diphosphokinase [Desulfovibrio sp.]|uniref:2-amino-4-hydroxy-6- hydroxymethyldihydropteridine diphosphokinase n=1 Tax=Desulfovibrio sp. TaxID=885 RepID=UPI00135E3688|nr:2-amino-4-hydroxy-6-hydroxymethyldihydropteridine diphosphokinase [Desulfovibrio sp.]MTJ92561.1 2-amino-4-hydroxy-6-hydroxymethyldihydropteridine diphosphokinase [Desulfovibrio sp.]